MNRRTIAAVLLALFLTTGVAAQEAASGVDSAMSALDEELRLHPEIGVTDIYKFLYQGVYGPGHAIEDRDAAARYLDEEMATLRPVEVQDPLCQSLGGDPAMVRVHLRPLKAAGGDRSALLDAFIASAEPASGDAASMETALRKAVTRLVRRSRFQLAGQMEDLAGRLAEEGYPPVHHSDGYVAAYQPAYRVVALELARRHEWCE